jgi:acetaldehyde dehydrogenase (acetylating)
MAEFKKLKIAIIGTGNIGTDLLIKSMRSKFITCSAFIGRNELSAGMIKAKTMGIRCSDQGLDFVANNPEIADLIFDCTSAQSHIRHWNILKKLGKTVIDMTPAKIGMMCVPAINADDCLDGDAKNINMITCGGQVSIPIAYAMSKAQNGFEYFEVASSIASKSAGPATRANLDEYVETTEAALQKFTEVKKTKAILILNPAVPPIDMQTTIYAKIKNPDIKLIQEAVSKMVATLREYVPGYQLIVPPTVDNDRVITTVKVLGEGDYLPSYAGNLDIINCAAISMAELIAKSKGSLSQ